MIWKIWRKDKSNSDKTYFSSIFSIFHIISQFSSVFSKSFHYSTCLSSILSISYHYSTCLSFIFSSRIVIRYGQYGRKASWNMKWYGNYGRKICWIVKCFGKYGRKASRRVIRYGQNKLAFLPYCPYLITIRLAFRPYFPYHFTIFFCIFKIFSLFNLGFFHLYWNDLENMEER
jgi:hypothetical protein